MSRVVLHSATLVHFGGIPCSVPPSPNVFCVTKPIPFGRWFHGSFLPAIWGTRSEGKSVGIYVLFSVAQQPQVGQGLLIIEASRSHSDIPQSAGLFWRSDLPDAEISTWQKHSRPTFIPHAGFEPAIPASELSQTHTLDRTFSGIGRD